MMKNLKKHVLTLIAILGVSTITTTMIAGCSKQSAGQTSSDEKKTGTSGAITVYSREDGSGTRGAFIELFEILKKDDNGNKQDLTTVEAVIANKTDVMLTGVASNDNAIGYVSLGSMNDSVKALQIDGITPSKDSVKDGSYKIARPFLIATKGEVNGLKKDFIDYILSKEGQDVVAKSYIAINDNAKPFAGTKPAGKIVVSGSSSVTPIMEKLKESYIAINPQAKIELLQSDSTAGMTGVKDGTFDIGMASRDLKDSEKSELTGIAIANDGIAVIVNPKNTMTNSTKEQIKNIFTGEITDWKDIK